MTNLILAVLLAVAQTPAPIPGKVSGSANRTGERVTKNADDNQSPTSPSSPAVNPVAANPHQGPGNTPKSENAEQTVAISKLPAVSVHRDLADWALWVFSGVLVLVGVFGVRAAYKTLEKVAEQTEATRAAAKAAVDSVEAFNKQVGLMAQQTKATEETAIAAKQSAAAANTNVEMFISKERARLRVTLKPLALSAPKFDTAYIIEFTVKNCGPTTAFVTQSRCVTYYGPKQMVESDEEAGAAVMFPIHSLPNEMSNSDPIETFAFLFFGDEASLVLAEIKEGRFFVGVRGSITYHDVFERERSTTFRYMWRTSLYAGDDPFSGDWIKCGSPDENKEA